jgi:hypothetical protein
MTDELPPIDKVMLWVFTDPRLDLDILGFIPTFFDLDDPRSAREQIDVNYAHGGGWHPFSGFKLLANGDLHFPEDPPTKLLATSRFRDEKIFFYEHGWLRVEQPDGTWEISRID